MFIVVLFFCLLILIILKNIREIKKKKKGPVRSGVEDLFPGRSKLPNLWYLQQRHLIYTPKMYPFKLPTNAPGQLEKIG